MNEAASGLRAAVAARLEALERTDAVRRIWERDFTMWRPEPAEIGDRLGWLTVAEDMRPRAGELRDFARACVTDGLRTAVLCGMGGSSLAPEVFGQTFGSARGFLQLQVLDTTHPDHIGAVVESLDLERTLFIVSSKSGTTTETRSHMELFWDLVGDGRRFVAITDPGTPLDEVAQERSFRHIFRNPADIGGRYSALSYFGLVPAALCGVELEVLLDPAVDEARACGPDVSPRAHPAARLGAFLGEAALAGRDKLTMPMPEPIGSLGRWIEQLIAESTGKNGTGILPVEGSGLGPPAVFGDDRVFAAIGEAGDNPILAWLERSGHPVDRQDAPDGLGGQMFRWEFATAVAGHVLGIHPFDQPDVQASKDATMRILSSGSVPEPEPGDLGQLLSTAEPPRYVAIQAYLPMDREHHDRLNVVRMRIRDQTRAAVTLGFGPRFLHSTGQFHKGGPPTGLFVQVVDRPHRDVAIPGQRHTFGTLIAAQSAGDAEALHERGRPLARVGLSELEAAAAKL